MFVSQVYISLAPNGATNFVVFVAIDISLLRSENES